MREYDKLPAMNEAIRAVRGKIAMWNGGVEGHRNDSAPLPHFLEGTMQLIGAGLPRTGTTSLQAALQRLGFGPCYHMVELYKRPGHARRWRAVAEGGAHAWAPIFEGYRATVDFPACLFYEELMVDFPDARVLLSVRDPERWYESTQATIAQLPTTFPWWLRRLLPRVDDLLHVAEQLFWQGFFEDHFEERAAAIARFQQWNAEVQRRVPPERLLVYDVKEGWEPLCAFLGVPVPDEPFPHLNDSRQLQRMIRTVRFLSAVLPIIAAVLVARALAAAFRKIMGASRV